jgi:hypothetical protein
LPRKVASRLRAKYLLFASVGLMIAYVVQHNESFLVNAADPAWNHYQPIKGRLLPHGIAIAAPLGVTIQYLNERTGDPRS